MASLLTRVLAQPARAASLSPQQWHLLVRQADGSALLAYLFDQLEQQNLLALLPEALNWRLTASRNVARSHQTSIDWEIRCLRRALAEVELPVLLLKGAAYQAAGLGFSTTRLYGDIDILVPEQKLNEVTQALQRHGWLFEEKDDYDQRFYRHWSHELPPLRNIYRFTNLDLHFTIFPRAGRYQPDAARLLEASIAVAEDGMVRTLGQLDRIIHCATHQFAEGEFDRALRNLIDLRELLRELDGCGGGAALLQRAELLTLTEPVIYALNALRRVLEYPLEPALAEQVDGWLARGFGRRLVAAAYCVALSPEHHSCLDFATRLARGGLYLRAHRLRLPYRLLIPHLLRKSWLKYVKQAQEPEPFQG